MVAVVSGNGLGLFNTSFTQLGGTQWGQSGIGQSRESQYVNIATGNLILRDLDEMITLRGFDASAFRTYNSQGSMSGPMGSDTFLTGYERSLALSGTVNTAGSSVLLAIGDGQTASFAYSTSLGKYVTTDGEGANDTLTWSGGATGTWTYIEGSTQREELYSAKGGAGQAASTTAYLTRIRNLLSDPTTPAQYTVTYDEQGRIWEVLGLDGREGPEAITYGYDASGRLGSITTRSGVTATTQVTFGYDGYNRLTSATSSLMASVSAGELYDVSTATTFTVNYAYVVNSSSDLRIASVSDSDGTLVSYTYDPLDATRIKSVTQGSSTDLSAQTIVFSYGANSTTLSDAAGRVWTYQYNSSKQLTSVTQPDGTVTSYTYTTASDPGGTGNVSQIKVVRSGVTLAQTDYSYDGNGNLAWQWSRVDGANASSSAVSRTYTLANQLQTETTYTGLDADGPGAGAPSGGMTTNLVYDGAGRQLRYVVDAMGGVRELNYGTGGDFGAGQLVSERRYAGATYSGAMDTASLGGWTTSAQKANSQLIEYTYDIKGRLAASVAYGALDANGNGLGDASNTVTQYLYDQQGLLRQKIELHGTDRNPTGVAAADSQATNYVYDGMGRLLTTVARRSQDAQTWGDASVIATTMAYLDATLQIRITTDAGAVRTETHNKAGVVTSVSEQPVGEQGSGAARLTDNVYDATGRLRATRDATGAVTYYFYEAISGRLSATVTDATSVSGAPTGEVRRFIYDYMGRVVQTVNYATRVSTSGWLSGTSTLSVSKDTLLYSATNPSPTASQAWVLADATNDRNSYRTYDALNRLATETTDSSSAAATLVTTYSYDGASRLLSVSQTAGGITRATRYFYDNAGRQTATLDAAGFLTESIYDAGGRLVKTLGYATQTQLANRATGTLSQLTPVLSDSDAVRRYFYDAQGRVSGQLVYASGTSGAMTGYLTQYVYDEQANTKAARAYAKPLTGLTGSESFAALQSLALTNAPSEFWQGTQQNFNGLGQLSLDINAEGTITQYFYDDAGQLIRTRQASNNATDYRDSIRTYDAFGNLIGEASAEGVFAWISQNGAEVQSLTPGQAAALCAAQGLVHSYDLAGRRIETTDANGYKTWYFYDLEGRSTFVVRGVYNGATKNGAGEVTETRYNAFGQATDQLAYTGKIVIGGTLSRADVQGAINTLAYVSTTDTRRQMSYDRRGLMTQLVSAENATSTFTYNGFGQVFTENLYTSSTAAVNVSHLYDERGLEFSRNEGYGGLSRSTSTVYDAFGRVLATLDGRGGRIDFTMDRMGRQISRTQSVGGVPETYGTSYDAFSRVISRTDALGKVTTLAYSDVARTVTVTTPEAIVTVTEHSRFGQTVRVTDGLNQSTTYTYNRDGKLTKETDALGHATTYNYNKGVLLSTVNAMGDVVAFTYDPLSRLLTRSEYSPGSIMTTTYAYDGQGRTVKVTDPTGRVVAYTYDREGRLTQEARDPTGLNIRTTYAYDAAGHQLTVTQAPGVTGVESVTQYAYDALGRRTSEVRGYGAGLLNLTTTYTYDANDNVVSKQDEAGNTTRFAYDEANRLRFTLGPAGNLSETRYNQNGQAYRIRDYANVVNMVNVAAGPLTVAQMQTVLANTGASTADQVQYRVYDQDGRWCYNIDGTGAAIGYRWTKSNLIDAEKHYYQRITDTNAMNALDAGTATIVQLQGAVPSGGTSNTLEIRTIDAAGRTIKTTDGLGNVTRYIYDDANRVVGVIDASGAVTRTWYDSAGRLIATRRFATAWAGATDTTTMSQLDVAMAFSWIDQDQQNYFIYDDADRLRFSVDPVKTWTEYTYDAVGRKTSERVHADTLNIDSTLLPKLQNGTALGFMPTGVNASADRVSYFVYDERNLLIYQIDSAGYVNAFAYDRAGRHVGNKDYAGAVGLDQATPIFQSATIRSRLVAGTISIAEMGQHVVPASATGADRVRYTALDGVGRLRYELTYLDGGQAAVVEWRYDFAGHVTAKVEYSITIAYANFLTDAQVKAAITAASGDVAANQRLTSYSYDGVGRLLSTTDNRNNVERYEYDAAGNRTKLTNKLGAVWTYTYDGVGRMTSQRSPSVAVVTIDSAGQDINPAPTQTILTTFTYDGGGHLLSTTENAESADPLAVRTTSYEYDGAGRRTKTIYPIAAVIDASGNMVAGSGPAPYEQVWYDTFGHQIVRRDKLGQFSYKAFDARGNLSFDIDTLGMVSAFGYNAFGEQTSLTRYAEALNTTAASFSGWAAQSPMSATRISGGIRAGASDRTITMVYDQRGNKVSVLQPAFVPADGANAVAPETRYVYDVWGNVVKESVLLSAASNTWAVTFTYFDLAGHRKLSVDAGGYVTTWAYNALGQLTAQTEYARPISTSGLVTAAAPSLPAAGEEAIGYDRTMTWTYDNLGRRDSETVLRRYATSNGGGVQGNVATTYTYDALDHLLSSSINGATTSMTYDALGRVISLTEPDRDVLLASAEATVTGSPSVTLTSTALYDHVSPYTTTAYDAFGNATLVRRYAGGWKAGSASPNDDRDQVTVSRFDVNGNVLMQGSRLGTVLSPTFQKVFKAYDKAGQLTRIWYDVVGSSAAYNHTVQTDIIYDAAGRQVQVSTQRIFSASTATDASEAVRYNAFGEIDQKAATLVELGVAGKFATYAYDNGGNLSSTDADGGVVKFYWYNLAHVQVRERHQALINGVLGLSQTDQVVDGLGRTTKFILPGYSDAGTATTLTRRFDRWGNVLEEIDPRGYSTSYIYNDRNQVIRETRPVVSVLSATGVETWEHPVYEYYYDAMGRLVGQRDPNGNLQQSVYNAAGQLLRSIDALGQITRQAYDAFGQNQLTEDAVGYMTFKTFDRRGRMLSHGDYLPNPAGTARAAKALESYTLDADGNRTSVSNGLLQSQLYDYDSRGLLVRSQSAMGVVKTYEYDAAGRKTKEADVSAYLAWTYDYRGRLVSHRDLGGANYSYNYDANSGQLTGESSDRAVSASGSHAVARWWDSDPNLFDDSGFSNIDTTQQIYARSYTYYANGQVKQISDASGSITYKYEYDSAGNRTMEESQTVDGQGKIVQTRTRVYYDGLNRIVQVTSDDLTSTTTQRKLDVRYDYDAVGNRRRVTTLNGYGPSAIQLVTANMSPDLGAVIANQNVKVGTAVSWMLTLKDYFLDPEGGSLTYTIKQANGNDLPTSWLNYTLDAVTGQVQFTASESAPVGQSISVRITATDGVSAPVNQVFTISTLANSVPVALSGGTPVVVLKQSQLAGFSLDASDLFRDLDLGDRLSLSLDSGAVPGLSISASSSAPDRLWISGTPTGVSSYTLSVRATDTSGAYVVRAVTVQVVASAAPTFLALSNRSLDIGDGFVVAKDLSQVFTDANADRMTVSARLSSGAELPSWMRFQYEPGSAPPRISLVGSVPPTAAAGTVYSVVLTARDIDGNSITTSFSLTLIAKPTNSTPSSGNITNKTINGGVAWSYQVPSFTDSNSDTLVYSAYDFYVRDRGNDPDPAGGPIHGPQTYDSYEQLPSWLSFDEATRTLSGTPPSAGQYEIAIRARDGSGAVATKKFVLTINAPTAAMAPRVSRSQTDLVITRGTPFNASAEFWDPNGSTLIYTVRLAGGGQAPSWMTINSSTGLITASPPIGEVVANYVVEIVATDTGGLTAVDQFNLSIVSAGGGVATGTESWYAYDAANRVTVVNGRLQNGQIVLGYAGSVYDTSPYAGGYVSYGMAYDAVGHAIATYKQISAEDALNVSQSVYNLRGQLQYVYADRALTLVDGTVAFNGANVAQQRTYDDAGRLTETREYFVAGQQSVPTPGPKGWLQKGETYTYDADGRITLQQSYGRIKGWIAANESNQTIAYQGGGGTLGAPLALISSSTTSYDNKGRVSGSTYTQSQWSREDVTQTMSAGFTHTFVNTYEARETYLEKSVIGTDPNTNFQPTNTISTYDAYGRRVEVKEVTTLKNYSSTITKLRYFSYDGQGGILTRRDGELKNGAFVQEENGYSAPWTLNQYYVYANGQQIAKANMGGNVDAISGLTAYDQDMPASAAVVQSGDSLEAISQRVYGNTNYWYVLAAANGVSRDSELVAGTILKVPSVDIAKNDATTFKPYNPQDAIGSTTPTLPYIKPPAAPGCSVGTIAMVIVAVVVSVVTYGVAAPEMTSLLGGTIIGTVGGLGVSLAGVVAGGFAAGLASSIASQVVGKALGVVDHFSLRQAVSSGFASAITAGIGAKLGGASAASAAKPLQMGSVGQALKDGQYFRAAGMAATTAASGYIGDRLAGLSTPFSWTSIAANAVSSVVSAEISNVVGLNPTVPFAGSGSIGSDFANGLISGATRLHVRRQFGFDDAVNYGGIAVDAVGSALGNAIAPAAVQWAQGKLLASRREQAALERLQSSITSAQAGIESAPRISVLKEALRSKSIQSNYENLLKEAVAQGLLPSSALTDGKDGGGYQWPTMREAQRSPDDALARNPNAAVDSVKFAIWAGEKYEVNLPLIPLDASVSEIAYVNELYLEPFAHPDNTRSLENVLVRGTRIMSFGEWAIDRTSTWARQTIQDLDDAATSGGGNWLTGVASVVRPVARVGLSLIEAGVGGTALLYDGNVRRQAGEAISAVAMHPGLVVDAAKHYYETHDGMDIAQDAFVAAGAAALTPGAPGVAIRGLKGVATLSTKGALLTGRAMIRGAERLSELRAALRGSSRATAYGVEGNVATSEITRERIVGSLGEVVEPHLGTIADLDADALVGFRGSLARGFKGEHKGGVPFDPTNFDVDAFIVSDKLAGQIGTRVRFRSGAKIDGIAGAQNSIDAALRQNPAFRGLKQEPFTFRIYTQDEIMRLQAKNDAQYFFLKPSQP